MLLNFIIVAGQVTTLFLLMSIGYIITKLGKLTLEGSQQLSYLVLFIVTPCLIVNSMQRSVGPEFLHNILVEIPVIIAIYVVYILICKPMFPSRNKETRSVLKFGMMFANCGFMGFPLINAVVGEVAMIYAAFFLVVFTIINWTYGVYLMGGKLNIVKILVNPGTVGLYIGLPMLLTGYTLPAVIGNTVGFVADLNTPLAMIVIGGQMARANIRETLGRVRLFEASAVRLVLLPIITSLALLPLHLDSQLYITLVVLSAVPTAGATSMFAETYHQNTAAAAQLVSLSTLLSLITLPVFAAFGMYLAGI